MMSEAQRQASILHTAQIALSLRQQIRAALPTPDEQYMTVMIPGKV